MEDAELLARRADHLVRLTKKATANLSHLAPAPRPIAAEPSEQPRPGVEQPIARQALEVRVPS